MDAGGWEGMTEAEWQSSGDADWLMLRFENAARSGAALRLSDRTLWHYAAGCVRRLGQLLQEHPLQEALKVTERFADGRATAEELTRVAEEVSALAIEKERRGALSEPWEGWSSACAANAVAFLTTEPPRGWEARTAAGWAADAIADRRWLATREGNRRWKAVKRREEAAQAALLRDVFGNPFRPVTVASTWLTPLVTSLAQAAYDARILPSGGLDAARLAVLSDALEEAGCTNEALLCHLRSLGPHVRGCWALDLVLGKS